MEKSSSQKASVRHLLKQLFPDAFFKGYPLEEPDVVGEDAIMSVRCIGDRETIPQPEKDQPQIPNTRSYAKCIKKTAEWNLKYKDCDHYLMCFDIDTLVPTTKGEEQEHRDTSRSEKDLERECDMEDQGLTPLSKKEPPYFDLDDPFPVDFAIGMKDRKTFRPWVLGWTARQLICSEDPTLRIDIPTGKTLLISGHRLTEEDADFLDIDGREGLTTRERMCTPVLLTGTDPGDFPDVAFAPWARNEIGEGEFQIFTLHRLVHEHTKKDLTLDCISTDSDFINLSLIYLEKFPFVNQITWRYAPRQGWIFYRETGSDDIGEERLDFKKLIAMLKAGDFVPDFRPVVSKKLPEEFEEDEVSIMRSEFTKLKEPVWDLVSLFVIGGSDYTAGFFGLPHHRLFEAMFKHSDYIGDLVIITPDDSDVGFRIRLDGGAFVRLIKSAYFIARSAKFKGFNGPDDVSIAVIRDRTSKLAVKNQFPSDKVIELKIAQATNYLEILAHVGERKIVESDPLFRGHYIVDPEKKAVKGNVFRTKE